jgi:curved DNA-binding protein CbpA
MKYTYFQECRTQEEAKALYRELVKKHHPDAGGNTRTMQDINEEYSTFKTRGATAEAKNRQRSAHAEGKKSAADYHDINEVSEKIREKILFALNLAGVEVELMGLWVWLTGETKQHREALKENGFKWSPNKTAWYYAGVPTFNRKKTTLDEIRNAYGSQTYARRENAGALSQ